MGFVDRLSSAASVAAEQAGKALDKGKTKASELQVQMKMDAAAKKLGYAVYDGRRGRDTDSATQEGLIQELSRLEGELGKIRQEAAAKATAREAKKANGFIATPGASTWGSEPKQGCAPESAASYEGAPAPEDQAPPGFTGNPE
jgi:hypothetical protein